MLFPTAKLTREQIIFTYPQLEEKFTKICTNYDEYIVSNYNIDGGLPYDDNLLTTFLEDKPFLIGIYNNKILKPTFDVFMTYVCDAYENTFIFTYSKFLAKISFLNIYNVSLKYCILHRGFYIQFQDLYNGRIIIIKYTDYIKNLIKVCVRFICFSDHTNIVDSFQ